MSTESNKTASIFFYGHIRKKYGQNCMGKKSTLKIAPFIRPEISSIVRRSIENDAEIFSKPDNTTDQILLSAISRQFLWELHSGIMLRLLENITGMENLLPDTHCKKSILIDSKRNTFPINTNNEKDSLQAALIMLINLEDGTAIIGHENAHWETPHYLAMQITYWQFHGEKR